MAEDEEWKRIKKETIDIQKPKAEDKYLKDEACYCSDYNPKCGYCKKAEDEVRITDFNREMTHEARQYYGEEYDGTR